MRGYIEVKGGDVVSVFFEQSRDWHLDTSYDDITFSRACVDAGDGVFAVMVNKNGRGVTVIEEVNPRTHRDLNTNMEAALRRKADEIDNGPRMTEDLRAQLIEAVNAEDGWDEGYREELLEAIALYETGERITIPPEADDDIEEDVYPVYSLMDYFGLV